MSNKGNAHIILSNKKKQICTYNVLAGAKELQLKQQKKKEKKKKKVQDCLWKLQW